MIEHSDSNFNPLDEILKLFPYKKPHFVEVETLQAVKLLLGKGGVSTDTMKEVHLLLTIFNDMGILDVSLDERSFLKVGNLYNGR